MSDSGDNYRHKGLRKKLVSAIREKGITDDKVIAAIENVPRHIFLESSFTETAYEDKAFQIGEGQTISQPYTVAFQTQLLKPDKHDHVLEIGTGSGYQSCVLAEIVERVFSVERHAPLVTKATKLIRELGYKNVRTFFGDGYEGLPAFAPYDKILITAAAPHIPGALKTQLKTGGIMVIPLGKGKVQKMIRLTKMPDGSFDTEEFEDFKFVPMLPGKEIRKK